METPAHPAQAKYTRLFNLNVWGWLLTLLLNPVFAEGHMIGEVKRGALLVANPSLDDPNFHQTVLLIVEHGARGTVGLVLNRPSDVLLAEVLPDFVVLKGTRHRLFIGGPVERTSLILLFRLTELRPDTRLIVNDLYVGTPTALERLMNNPRPSEAFRAFTGFAGWAPGQLEQEMREGAWEVLPSETFNIFDHDPASLWSDSHSRVQIPRTISYSLGYPHNR